jgi:hypothetical protein
MAGQQIVICVIVGHLGVDATERFLQDVERPRRRGVLHCIRTSDDSEDREHIATERLRRPLPLVFEE